MPSQFLALGPILVLLVVVVAVALGVWLIRSKGAASGPEPRCGKCGYNLTASESNRCPECGLLFIDAGILKGPQVSSRGRKRAGLALILIPIGLLLVAVPSILFHRQALAQRAQARAAIQRAKQTQLFMQQVLTAATQPAETSFWQVLQRVLTSTTQPSETIADPTD